MARTVKKKITRKASTKAPKFESKIKDKVTGVSGTMNGVYLTRRAPRYEMEFIDSNGRVQREWFDAERIVSVK